MTDEVNSILRFAYEKTSFMLGKHFINKSEFVLSYIDTLIYLLTNSSKERGIVLHHGTSIPLYFAIAITAFKAYLSDDSDNTAFLNDLNIDDLVIYNDKRGVYKGKDPNGNIIIVNKDKGGTPTTNYVPVTSANKIQPYYGDGKTLDGRGIRKKRNIIDTISGLFGIKKQEVKSVITKGVVIVCDRYKADEIFGHMTLSINGKRVRMCELFAAAYYTSNDVYHYPGNVAKTDPVIRFVNKISLAREMILEDPEIETLVISDLNYLSNSSSELASIYERTSLKSIILLGEICKGISSPLFNELDNLQPFVWTRDILINYENYYIQEEHIHDEYIHPESKQLRQMIKNHINLEIEIVEIKEFFINEDFRDCKKILLQLLKQNDGLLSKLVQKAYWLINLLEKSIFPISVMEEIITKNQINAPSPTTEFAALEMAANNYLGTNIETQLKFIIEEISGKFFEMQYTNPKFEYLLKNITNGIDQGEAAVICPKIYYKKIFTEAVPDHLRKLIEKVDFFTPNNYSSSKIYQNVYVVGALDWSNLNPLLLSNSGSVKLILYPNELNRYQQANMYTQSRLSVLSKNNSLVKESSSSNNNSPVIPLSYKAVSEEIYIEDQLEALSESLSLSYLGELPVPSSNTVIQPLEIKRIALLDSGERIFLTRFYSAYIYNMDKKSVQETDVYSLSEGDLLIFTNYDSTTRDIVEKIMNIVIESDNCSEQFRESYRRSQRWKKSLREYVHSRQISFKQLSEMMERLGSPKHEVTLRTWLDEESHIVGPRDIESYRIIAKLLQDPEMLESPEIYYQSSREVRSMKVRILKYLGKNIIRTLNKNEEIYDDILSLLPIDLSKMSRIVQIEKIINIENLIVPPHLANRPIQF
ncbi:DrmE family protein [Paenibacillus barengoltzii]|uniref:DISARM protein DrmE C-terminal domain-containing protein n=1 Tax=Paenibacillus barengoltzii G22 TaxID=1235795 RepID=R9L692_9BACL|nr:DrmE family protein [Paenibacillus barengoltzii]EOS54294.1 hypothetical protein C812_03534 [Paenibacillus barengoltzii G22]